jgi:hypothetical protein
MTEYQPAIKRNAILIHVTTWMNLENTTPSEGNQTGNDKCRMIPLR